MTPTQLVATAAVLLNRSVTTADIQIVSQTRELNVRALNNSYIGHEQAEQSAAAPGTGIWNESLAVSTPCSSAAAALNSVVSSSVIIAHSTTEVHASNFVTPAGFGSTATAEATSRFRITFNVDSPTPIRFQASIPTAIVYPPTLPFTQQMWIYLRDLTTGHNIAHVVAGWDVVGNYPVVEDAVDLSIVLATGQYQIDALLEHQGTGSWQTPPYIDEASFIVSVTAGCYANCDGSTIAPTLTANDFQCFLNRFAAGSADANCDGSTNRPVLTANDFMCFINKFAAGCGN